MIVILHLFTLLFLVAVGFYVFVADPRRRSHQTFAAFIAFFGLWTIKDLIFWNFYPQDSTAGWWAAASFVTALLMQFSLAIFAWVFPENSRTPRRKAAMLFAPGLVLIPAAFLGLLWNQVGFENGRFMLELTFLAYVFVGYIYFIFGYSTIVLFRKYRMYRGTQRGQQVGAIILGSLLTALLFSIVIFAFPFFGYPGLLSISSMLALPGAVIYAYAILNFELFSLKTALNQFRLFPLTYKVAVSIGAIAITSFVIFQLPITYWAFRNGMDAEAWRRYLVFSVVAALVPNLLLLLIVLRIISRPIQRFTLAALAVTKGEYGTKVDLRRSNDEIGILAGSFNTMSERMADDLTQLRKLNSRLLRSEKLAAIGAFASGVADEIEAPLSSVSSEIKAMRNEEGHSVATRERLVRIYEEIGRIRKLTDDLSTFANSSPFGEKPIDVNTVLDSAFAAAMADKEFSQLSISLDYSHDILLVLTDGTQLEQIFLNLMLMILEAIPTRGTMKLSTKATDDQVLIDFIGKRTDQATEYISAQNTKVSGKNLSGLGLSICSSMLVAMNGRLDLIEFKPDHVSFRVVLPREKLF